MTPQTGTTGAPRHVLAGRLWSGGAATALVAVLIALVGFLVVESVLGREIVQVPVLGLADSYLVSYLLTVGVLALAATGLAHLLLLFTPRPRSFFSWIVGLATVAAAAVPFTAEGARTDQVVTGILALVIGIAVGSLLASVMTLSVQRRPPAAGDGPAPGYRPPPPVR